VTETVALWLAIALPSIAVVATRRRRTRHGSRFGTTSVRAGTEAAETRPSLSHPAMINYIL